MTNWTRRAACAPFPELFERVAYSVTDRITDPGDLAEAKATCIGCSVQSECLQSAMHEESLLSGVERHGIRGGLLPADRVTLAAENPLCALCEENPRQDYNPKRPQGFRPLCKSCQISTQNDMMARYLPPRRIEVAAKEDRPAEEPAR